MKNIKSSLIEFLVKLYKKFDKMKKFDKPSFFLDNSTNSKTACFILAGYKEFTWDIVFKRIKQFCPENIDVCIVSSGLYSEDLKKIAEDYNWSYISMKRNCVTLALNSAIREFKNAENIFKLDEDIFITEGFFNSLLKVHEEAKKDYFPCFSAPLIPLNAYCYRIILEKLELTQQYTELFEYPKITTGIRAKIDNDSDVAKFFWGKGGYIPQIDELNRKIKHGCKKVNYSVCPIRFTIGAIFFERKILEDNLWFPVTIVGNGMGADEKFLCNLATSKSNAIIVTECQVVGHLGFGEQNKEMENYFKNNKEFFEIR